MESFAKFLLDDYTKLQERAQAALPFFKKTFYQYFPYEPDLPVLLLFEDATLRQMFEVMKANDESGDKESVSSYKLIAVLNDEHQSFSISQFTLIEKEGTVHMHGKNNVFYHQLGNRSQKAWVDIVYTTNLKYSSVVGFSKISFFTKETQYKEEHYVHLYIKPSDQK